MKQTIQSILFFIPFLIQANQVSLELDETYPVMLELTGRYKITYNLQNTQVESRFSKKGMIFEKNYQLIWGDETTASDRFTIEPLEETRLLINGKQYSGSICCEYGKPLINLTSVDDLIHTVLQKKAFNSYDIETLKALAVTLRTDFLSEKAILSASDFDFEGQALLFQHPKITQAIIETKDLVLMHQGQIFPTTFSIDAGGNNAQFDAIFRKKTEAPQGTTLPFASSCSWTKVLSKHALCEILHLENLKNLAFYKDHNSSKNYAVKVTDTKGSKVLLIDHFMDMCDLKSNDFNLRVEKDNFIFDGKGEGLGVGLCLKTAQKLAKEGKDFKSILQVCYPETEIHLLKN